MTRTVAIVQARLGSRRLPGKVLYELGGRPMIAFLIDRVRQAKGLDAVVLATGDGAENDSLAAVGESLGIAVFRGSEDDVLSRFAGAARAAGADTVVRLTGDCPLSDPPVIEQALALRAEGDLDYCSNVRPPTWPDGLDLSVFTRALLERADREATLGSDREHVVPWMWRAVEEAKQGGLRTANLPCPQDLSSLRWTVDEADDYLMLRALDRAAGPGRLQTMRWREILRLTEERPEIPRLNAGGIRDAGLARSLEQDKV